MSNLKTSVKSNHKIFDSLNVYQPEEYKKNHYLEFPQPANNSLFDSAKKKSPQNIKEVDNKHFDFLKSQNQEIFSSKNRLAILESEISRITKLHDKEISDYKEKISELEKNLLVSNKENDRLCTTLITLNSELEHWKKEHTVLDSKLIRFTLENDKLMRYNKQASEEMDHWKEKMSLGENNLMSTYKDLELMQSKIDSHNQVVEGLEKEIEIINENNLKLESLCKRLRKENENLLEKNVKLEQLIQASQEDLDEMRAEYNKLHNNNDKKLDELKEEGSKVIVEVNLKYQELFNKKNMLDDQYKQVIQQNKELIQRITSNEATIQEKNHIIMELEMKMNSHGGELEEIIKELAKKDETIYRLKTEKIKTVSKFESRLSGFQQSNKFVSKKEDEPNYNLKWQEINEQERQEKEKLEEKISHLLQKMLLISAENDRLHYIIKSYKA